MAAVRVEVGAGHEGHALAYGVVEDLYGAHSLGQLGPDEQAALGYGVPGARREGLKAVQHGVQLLAIVVADALQVTGHQTLAQVGVYDGLVEQG